MAKTYINVIGYEITTKHKYVHREVAEKALGRKLRTTEVVHHVDYNKQNNSPNNLVICSPTYHGLIHARTDAVNAGFNPNTHSLCSECKTYHPSAEFPKNRNKKSGVHNVCKTKSNQIRKQMGYKSPWNWLLALRQQYRRAKSGYKQNVLISWLEEYNEGIN
jgi:hypothetical protein